jgi:hypothetical protein
MSEPRLFTEEEVRKIVEEEVLKNLRVSGWAGLESNCGYSHVNGGASATWNGQTIGRKSESKRLVNAPVQTV